MDFITITIAFDGTYIITMSYHPQPDDINVRVGLVNPYPVDFILRLALL